MCISLALQQENGRSGGTQQLYNRSTKGRPQIGSNKQASKQTRTQARTGSRPQQQLLAARPDRERGATVGRSRVVGQRLKQTVGIRAAVDYGSVIQVGTVGRDAIVGGDRAGGAGHVAEPQLAGTVAARRSVGTERAGVDRVAVADSLSRVTGATVVGELVAKYRHLTAGQKGRDAARFRIQGEQVFEGKIGCGALEIQIKIKVHDGAVATGKAGGTLVPTGPGDGNVEIGNGVVEGVNVKTLRRIEARLFCSTHVGPSAKACNTQSRQVWERITLCS